MKLKFENKIEVVGKVRNFKIKETKSTGKKFAAITIKDELENNIVFVNLYDRDTLTYGRGDDKKEVTLNGLKNIFLNSKEEPKDVLVSAVGSASDFEGEDGAIFETNNVFFINPYDKEDHQKAVFTLGGIVESVKESTDDEGDTVLKIKLGVLQTRGKDKDITVTGVNYKTVVASGKVADKLIDKDIEKGCFVTLIGDMLNILPERDKYGQLVGNGTRKFNVVVANDFVAADDIEDEDLSIYKKAKRLGRGESFKLEPKSKDLSDFDDDFDD